MPASNVRVGDREFRVKNLDKVLFPADGFTKADLLRYHLTVAPVMLAHLRDRPLVFTRHPDGIDQHAFYQKDIMPAAPDWLPLFPHYSSGSDRVIRFALCDHPAALAWFVAQGVIGIHPWMSRTSSPEQPDWTAFDLDPAPPAGFDEVRECAYQLHRVLSQLGYGGIPKTSGATGMHVYVPLAPGHSYRQSRRFALSVADVLRRKLPHLVTLERRVDGRAGKVYLDCLQNYRGKTLAAPYSVRPLPGAPVSTPIAWDELDRCCPEQFTILTVPERVRARRDLFANALSDAHHLPPDR